MPYEVGKSIGPNRILEQLGRCGIKAYHPALDRHIAIAVLHSAIMEDPNFRRDWV